jgi:hypothetical protein
MDPICLHLQMRYTYLGDKLTRPGLKGAQCDPIRRPEAACHRFNGSVRGEKSRKVRGT